MIWKNFITLILVAFATFSVFSQQLQTDTEKQAITKMNLEVVKLFNEKKYAEALPIAEKSLKLTEKVYGATTVEMAKAYSNLGYILSFMNETKEAENSFEKASKIYKKLPNLSKEETDEFVSVLERFAILKEQREFRLAESALEEAVQWREKVSGTKANQLIQTYFLLANINYWNKNFKKSALTYYKVLELIDINKTITDEAANMAYSRCRCAYVKAGRDTEIKDLEKRFERDAPTDTTFSFIRFMGTIVNGKALNLFQPTYPEEAKRDLARGEVIVEVLIGKSGKVLSACATNKAHKALIETAEVAAMKSTFSPTTVNGEAKNVTGTIVYKFGV